jgi:26S proteasome regulatory subunit (ATPase 3-interacting protein)
VKWRTEWVRRKKIFQECDTFSRCSGQKQPTYLCFFSRSLWQLATDSMTSQDALTFAEDMGIEQDTNEHAIVERGPLGIAHKNLKRKR